MEGKLVRFEERKASEGPEVLGTEESRARSKKLKHTGDPCPNDLVVVQVPQGLSIPCNRFSILVPFRRNEAPTLSERIHRGRFR